MLFGWTSLEVKWAMRCGGGGWWACECPYPELVRLFFLLSCVLLHIIIVKGKIIYVTLEFEVEQYIMEKRRVAINVMMMMMDEYTSGGGKAHFKFEEGVAENHYVNENLYALHYASSKSRWWRWKGWYSCFIIENCINIHDCGITEKIKGLALQKKCLLLERCPSFLIIVIKWNHNRLSISFIAL